MSTELGPEGLLSKKEAVDVIKSMGFSDPMFVIDGKTVLAHFFEFSGSTRTQSFSGYRRLFTEAQHEHDHSKALMGLYEKTC